MNRTPLPSALLLAVSCLSSLAIAQAQESDETKAAKVEFQRRAESCLTASTQSVSFKLVPKLSKPLSEPASPEEEARVKRLLESSGLTYDRAKNRVSYEFTLSLIRTKNAAVFSLKPQLPPESTGPIHECLRRLAAIADMDSIFE
jgi:hypothetical protein